MMLPLYVLAQRLAAVIPIAAQVGVSLSIRTSDLGLHVVVRCGDVVIFERHARRDNTAAWIRVIGDAIAAVERTIAIEGRAAA